MVAEKHFELGGIKHFELGGIVLKRWGWSIMRTLFAKISRRRNIVF